MAESDVAVFEPDVQEPETTVRTQQQPPKHKRQPRYHVILWDSTDHTFDYVIMMMQQLFGYELERAFLLAKEVHTSGRGVCLTTTREHAELKRDQIHAFGKDPLLARCAGSMSCSIEPEVTG